MGKRAGGPAFASYGAAAFAGAKTEKSLIVKGEGPLIVNRKNVNGEGRRARERFKVQGSGFKVQG